MVAQELKIRISADGTAAIAGMRQVQGELGRTGRSADELNAGFGRAVGGLKSLALTAAAGIGIAELARAFISVNLEAQKTAKALAAVTGSTQAAATEMAYIKDTANQMGLAVNDVATAYTNLMAASKGTALEGQATRDIFEAVSLTMAKLGKSSADTQGALLGLEQLMGQTTANLEDLRQVTDRIPGGMKLAAEGMGLTVAEMKEMISKGEILVADIVPGLTSEFRRFYDDGQEIAGLQAEWNRFTNAMADVAVGFDGVTDATGLLSNALSLATDLARGLASALAAAANAKAGLGLTTFADDAEKLAAMEARRLRALQDYQDAVALASRDNGTIWDGLTEWSADVEGKLQTLQQVSEEQFKFAAGLRESADAAREQAAAQAASMNDGAVKLYEEQRARVDEANQSLLKLNATYDDTAKRQLQVAEATKKYQAIAKDLGKDEAWVTQQVEKYAASLDKSTTAKGGAAKASKALAAADREGAKAVAEAERAVQSLIDRYLPARAAAEDHARAQAAVAAALAGQAGSVALSAAEAEKIMGELTKEQAAAAEAARRESDAFYNAWAEAVDSLDDTFQSLWRGLITGQGDVLGNLKETVLEWVADLSYQLLLSPLIVPIQGSLMGIMGGGAGMAGTGTSLLGTASNLGTAADLFGFGNPLSSLTSAFSTATGYVMNFASAAAAGASTIGGLSSQAAMLAAQTADFGLAGATLTGQALGSSTVASAMVAALPVAVAVAAAVAIFSKWQSDQEPRYGTLAAMTGGSAKGLEDNEWGAASGAYVKGSFGLSFGLTDKGSKNMEATELTQVYQALADVSDALAQFFGEDLSAFITEELKNLSDFGDGLIHLTENEGDLGEAMAALVERIAQAAGRSSEDIGIAFGALVGDLSGTAEEVGEQIQAAMVASALAVELSDRYDDSLGQMLDLTGDITGDVKRLKGYIDQFGASGETSVQTLSRLVAQLGVLDTAAQQTATDLEGLSATALLTLSDELVGAFGGLDAAAQATAFYYDQFTTATEKLVDVVEAAGREVATGLADLVTDLAGSLSEADMAVLSAQLTSPLLDTRAGFEELIGSLDLTTEAGQKLYAELLKLAPAFDLLYDGVEAFEDWLLGTDKMEQATRDLQKVFDEWGMTIPATREALQALYESGAFSTEQLAILAAHLEQLGIVFGNLGTDVDNVADKIVDYTNLQIRLAEAQGNDALALQLRRQQELDAAADDYSRSLLLQIYAHEDAAAAAAKAREEHRRQWEEAEAARRAAYDAEVEAIRSWNDAAQAAANAANQAAREALQQLQQAAENAYRVASDIANAWIEAIAAAGLVAEATALQRRMESAAMDPALRSAYSQVWSIQDAATMAGGRADLAIQALGLLGRDADARAAERALTLAGTDPALRGLQQWIFSLEDAQLAAEEAAGGIEELIGSLEQASAAIGGALERVNDLLTAPIEMQAQRRADARAQLANLLAAARSGTMPTAEALEQPLSTLSQDPAALFSNRIAYLRDLGRTRGELAELQGLVDAQIPIEEQNLEALKNLPVSLYPNFEAIVSAIGTTSTDTASLLSQANAAIDAAIAAMAARDAALQQSIQEIAPEIREIPPYVQDVYEEIDLVGNDIVSGLTGLRAILLNIDANGDNLITEAEMISALNHVLTREKIQTLFAGLDINQDGVIDALELNIGNLVPLLQAIDLDGDGNLKWSEFQTALQYLASDEELRNLFDLLDTNGDGVLSELEILNAVTLGGIDTTTGRLDLVLDRIGNLAGYLQPLYNVNNTWLPLIPQYIDATNDYLVATNNYLASTNSWLDSINGRLVSGSTSAATFLSNISQYTYNASSFLSTLVGLAGYLQPLYDLNNTWLPLIPQYIDATNDYLVATNNYLASTNSWLGSINGRLVSGSTSAATFLSNISQYTYNASSFLSTLVGYAATSNARGYATGGIATGPLSGYGVTLHGNEAIIPLGDGNTVTAQLKAPLPPPPNLIAREAGDSLALRQALAELQAEVHALRSEAQVASAATVGELKDHNRRERRRDVVGAKVEVIS